MIINISNVEKLIFYDKKVQQLFPELTSTFQKWAIGVRSGINSIAKDALLEFLEKVTEEQLKKLESYFSSPVSTEKQDKHLIKNSVINIKDNYDFNWNVSISRDDELLYICCWR